MLKKLLSNFLILTIVLGLFPTHYIYADFNISTFQINGSSNSEFYFNPDDTFTITAYATNDIGEDIKDVRVKVEFNDNGDFNYTGTDQRAQIQGVDTYNPIPAGDYSSSTGLDTPISITDVSSGQFLMLKKISNAQSAFEISNNISSYTNSVTVTFNAKKVSDSSNVLGTSSSKTIYVNVKPHIVDKYFEKSGVATTTIKGNGAESVDLFVKVKDYNGCTNIDNNSVTADLSLLGLSSDESLIYDSCEGDGKTALFKKSGITTLASLGTKVFNHTDFSFSDEDGNSIDPNDSNFVEAGETNSVSITVESPGAPDITDLGTSDDYIGGPGETSATISFSANQSGTSKVALDSCTQSDTNKIFEDTTAYSGSTVKNIIIDSSKLSEGNNDIFACVDNGLGDVGSYTFNITKDTVDPIINLLSYTANITTGNVNLDYTCNEDGDYKIEVTNGSGTTTAVDYTSTTATTEVNTSIPHTDLELGSNTITVYCRDNANNEVSQTGLVNKVPPTPSMAGEVSSFIDNDIDNNGLNGIDLKIDWNSTIGSSFSHFESWRLYVLPSSTTLNTTTHNYIALITDSSSGSYIGNESLTQDSAGDTLINGGSYKAYVAIMGTSGELGTPGESGATTLVSDTIEQATVTSAEFIGDTQLKIYTDTTLDTVLGSHDASLISFDANGNKTAISIDSISGQNIIVNIPSLSVKSITGTNLTIGTGALHSAAGGYNDLITGINISDKQAPDITAFINNTSPNYGNYYNNNLDFSWNSDEDLTSGNTYIQFSRSSGNIDNTTHKANITNPALLLVGSHNSVIEIDSNTNSNEVLLTCGTIYNAQFIGEDSAGNSTSSSVISNIGFDNCAPTTPTQNELTLEGNSNFNLTWNTSIDDNGNGSGIRDYTIEVFSGSGCSSTHQSFSGVTTTSQAVILTNGSYSWNIKAFDNIGNESGTSSCDDFEVNSDIPTFSNQIITDTVLSNTTYAKDGNTVEITADISNTNINNITANLSALTGNAGDNAVACSSPTAGITCNYLGSTVTYGFTLGYAGSISEGVRQADIIANNTSGINTRNQLVSITVDKNNPNVTSNAITFPNGGETVGGTGVTITWNIANVSDTIGLSGVDIHILKGGIDQGSICSGTNIGTCEWDITSVSSDSDYSVELRATDLVGNISTDISDANFTVDRNAPTVPSNAITSPNGGAIYKGGENINILWNSGSISDAGGLATNPITLQYSINNGSTYSQIATNESNDGTYSWNLPNVNSDEVLAKIIAVDNVTNSSEDISDATFIIDSTDPVLNVNFAGNGGNTPQNGKYINNSGINLTLTNSDDYMDSIYYTFENTSNGTYWNGSTFTGGLVNNTLCSDGSILATDNSCDTINANISPTIVHSNTYRMTIFAADEAGNITTSTFIDYTGDTTDPTVNISTASGTYISDSISLSGTSSDTDSGISSVYIQIKKGSDYWNGSSFVNSVESLLTNTSDNYSNWTYDFTLPAGDSDGEIYEIIVTAHDSAFKINNTNSSTINIIKDSSGPNISAGVITNPAGGEIYSGGDDIIINWTTGSLTDSVSGLTSNPIKLEYFDGSSYNLIADNLSNSGSYNWNTIPSIDTNNARVRITATDNAGNESFQNSNAFSIDSTNPTIDTISTIENNISNGKINALRITFSENIDDSSIVFGDFSIDGGSITPTGISTGGSSDDDEVLLLFNETGDTGDTPTLQYTGTSVSDLAGRKLQNTSTLSSNDEATPRVLDIEIFDTNDNGKLDKIEITFSENLNSTSTISGWNIDNILSGMSINSLSVSGNIINLFLGESDSFDTSSNSLGLDLSSSIYSDPAGNFTENFSNQTIDDKAEPIKLSTQTLDLDSNYKADTIRLSFSEDISGEILGEFNISNLSTGSTLAGVATSGSNLDLTLNETTADNDTANAFTVEYTGTSLTDSSSNQVNTIASHTSDDLIEPKILSRETNDSNNNGFIDGIIITTSENLNDNFTSTNISVEGYTVNNYTSGIANDNIFSIDLDEKNTADSSATPNIRIISNTSLGDTVNNIISDEAGTTQSDDKVGPVIISARYDEVGAGVADDIIYVTFSEDITAGSVDTSVGGSLNDFEITLGGALGASSTTSIISPTEVMITLGAGANPLSAGTSKIGINTGALTDSNSNNSQTLSNNNRVVVSASIIINEVMFSTDTNNQYIELKNLGSASVDISGWIIENAGGNGVNLTISSGNITGNGFYLIAKQSSGVSLLNVTPDLIDGTLNLNNSSQNNLILTDGSTTYDTVLASAWPAGDNTTPKSMERKITPGDGTIASNWYTAETSTGFDNATIKGTPGVANVFDGQAPSIDSYFPAANDLLPTAGHIRFDYSDSGVGVNSATATVNLQKWNGSSYGADTSGTDITNNDVNNSRAIYTLDDLDEGRYRTQFSIDDNAGNTVNQEIVFYIDKFSMKITGGDINMGDITPSVEQFSTGEITITVKTIGAGFTLSQNKSGLFSQGITNIGDFDGSYGFGYDIYKDENGSITNYSSTISQINGSNIANVSKNIDINGVLKTYTFRVKSGVKTGGMQSPGKYTTDINYILTNSY